MRAELRVGSGFSRDSLSLFSAPERILSALASLELDSASLMEDTRLAGGTEGEERGGEGRGMNMKGIHYIKGFIFLQVWRGEVAMVGADVNGCAYNYFIWHIPTKGGPGPRKALKTDAPRLLLRLKFHFGCENS